MTLLACKAHEEPSAASTHDQTLQARANRTLAQWPAIAFTTTSLVAAYLGLAPTTLPTSTIPQSDKVLHFLTFLLLTLFFYWIPETLNRRRTLQLTLLICTLALGVGSEVLQALLPNGREFDGWDIVANVMGSGIAVAGCGWYHRRMVERKRKAKGVGYTGVPGEDPDVDVELGDVEGEGGGQESGVVGARGEGEVGLEEEVDNWDENAEDWDEDEATAAESGASADGIALKDVSEESQKDKRAD